MILTIHRKGWKGFADRPPLKIYYVIIMTNKILIPGTAAEGRNKHQYKNQIINSLDLAQA